jgi:hypothetical protein
MGLLWQDRLDAPRQLAPRQHHPVAATFTFQSNVRAEARDRPLVGTTRVRLAQSNHIVKLQVGEHMLNREKRMKGKKDYTVINRPQV